MRSSTLLKITFYSLFIFLAFACGSGIDKTQVLGTWQAVSLVENGQPGSTDLSQTKFTFHPTGQYDYQSNVNYKEQGTYYIDGKFLVSKDTLNAGISKSVRIEFLSADSMLFNMNSNGAPQLLGLKKVK